MAFRVKNLMIHVLPGEGEQLQPQLAAAQPNFCVPELTVIHVHCSIINCGATFGGITAFTPIIGGPDGTIDPDALATLKAQLQDTLKEVEVQERVANEQTSIQTIEEAQVLEDHLTAALDEVRRQKQELQNKSAGGQG